LLLVNLRGLVIFGQLHVDFCHLLDHLLLLLLDPDILEVPPLGQNLHRLDILDGCQLVPIVLIPTERVKIDLLPKAFIFPFHNLEYIQNLLTIVDFFVIDSYDGVENGPHNLRVINSA
jgi:hypothetical protein